MASMSEAWVLLALQSPAWRGSRAPQPMLGRERWLSAVVVASRFLRLCFVSLLLSWQQSGLIVWLGGCRRQESGSPSNVKCWRLATALARTQVRKTACSTHFSCLLLSFLVSPSCVWQGGHTKGATHSCGRRFTDG